MLFISLCANTWLFRAEINFYRGSLYKNYCSYLWNIDSQNQVDVVTITFTYLYIFLRYLMPSQSFLEEENMYADDPYELIFKAMPILHTLMLILLTCQAHFYLKLHSGIAKFVHLFWRALSDMQSFIIIEVLIICLMASVMQV